MSSRVVVTGAAGFIGRNMVAELNARGVDDLLLVDNLGSDEKWRNLVGLRYAELLDARQFLTLVEAGALSGVDAMIHLGACSATTERDADFLLRQQLPLYAHAVRVEPKPRRALHLCLQRGHLWRRQPGL